MDVEMHTHIMYVGCGHYVLIRVYEELCPDMRVNVLLR